MPVSISSTASDYLEAIYEIEQRKRVVRGRDVANALQVHKSTVSAAIKALARKKLVNYEPYEVVTLTELGIQKAQRLIEAREIVRLFLREVLDVGSKVAEGNARRLQYGVDEEVIERLVCFLVFMDQHPQQRKSCIEEFQKFRHNSYQKEKCHELIRRFLDERTTGTPRLGNDARGTRDGQSRTGTQNEETPFAQAQGRMLGHLTNT